MEAHRKLSDAMFERQFAQCELDPELFTHEAHLRLAWIHIKNYGPSKAETNIQYQLKRFVAAVGSTDKYNTTLTVAAIKAVHHFMQKSTSHTFTNFIAEFPQLKYNFKELMGRHYGYDIYESSEAKRVYLEPDLLPFD